MRTSIMLWSILKGFIGFTRNFVTVAEAKADKFLRVGQKISIDERGNAIFIVINGQGLINGYNIIGHASLNISFNLVVNDVANALWYGAKGDGVSDDTYPIQALFNSLGAVYIAKGDYRVTSTLIVPSNLHVNMDKQARIFVEDGFLTTGTGRVLLNLGGDNWRGDRWWFRGY